MSAKAIPTATKHPAIREFILPFESGLMETYPETPTGKTASSQDE
jgi:hypothetical protein